MVLRTGSCWRQDRRTRHNPGRDGENRQVRPPVLLGTPSALRQRGDGVNRRGLRLMGQGAPRERRPNLQGQFLHHPAEDSMGGGGQEVQGHRHRAHRQGRHPLPNFSRGQGGDCDTEKHLPGAPVSYGIQGRRQRRAVVEVPRTGNHRLRVLGYPRYDRRHELAGDEAHRSGLRG